MLNRQEELTSTLEQIVPAQQGWISIGLSLLHEEQYAPCDLYRKVSAHLWRVGEPEHVLFAGKGLPFGQDIQGKLSFFGIQSLYIREKDAQLYYDYVQKVTQEILHDPISSPDRKAGAVYNCCREIMRKVYDDPRAPFLRLAEEIITPTVDLIIGDDRTTNCLVKLAGYDNNTYTHCTNVGIFGIALARSYYGAKAEKEIRQLGAGFFLHDLGKCKIPLEIINKPGPLTAEERTIIQQHPLAGLEILKKSPTICEEAKLVAAQHHERDDGKGYSSGLVRVEIHPYARICRIADIYEALTSDRSYHKRRSTFEALKIMKEDLVSDLDHELYNHFVRLFATG